MSVGVSDVLCAAAEMIDVHGWVQNSFGDEHRGLCLLTAVLRASREAGEFNAVLFDCSHDTLKAHLPAGVESLTDFNDKHDTTRDTVMKWLRGVAAHTSRLHTKERCE